MAESAAELTENSVVTSGQPPLHNSNRTLPTVDELVAKAIAPVKAEFLRPPPSRTNQNDTAVSDSSVIAKEKKSKRQLKRERRQSSALHLCSEVAKSEDASSCIYGDKCRFSHDVEAFKDQKPADLEGKCPFTNGEGPCPYGLACRFYGTHEAGVRGNGSNSRSRSSEINGLNKDVQKLLWKNKMKFPKADANLKALGLVGPSNSRVKKQDEDEVDLTARDDSRATNEKDCGDTTDKLEVPKNCVDETDKSECALEVPKNCINKTDKSECSLEVPKDCSDENDNLECSSEVPTEYNEGLSIPDKDFEKSCGETELEGVTGNAETDKVLKMHPREKKLIDFREKLYLAPLTTVGNLPFRRVCKALGADITCGEMAMCTNLLQGQASEWALLRRHSSEDLFGVQICGAYPDTVTRTIELIDQECEVDFIDINMGCPIDIVVNKGAGSCLLNKPMRMKNMVAAACGTVDKPITIKVRTGYFEGKNRVDSLIADIATWGTNAVTVHGRTRQQRYSKLADWNYIYKCAEKAPESFQVLGNGDIFSYTDWNKHKSDCPQLASCMIARGALVKPWIFTEIKEQRHWDISSGERLDILKDYVRCGLEHWGSDTKGVETTRHFLLEWLSYTFRYIPVGLLEVVPQQINWRPPSYCGRDDLETMMASESAADWIRISELLLGKVPDGFTFSPKHKSNAYDKAENG
ncbi:tRNA-dihydrouridine(47) synthase [NAD(P)(+)]-like isoform X2 [Euphorbia lathyris]|uniref:tRNA-dihydrouridine(47) synthase [NAD(P)(+)]-like isoform X2 n=1 Tax=Euphorbia lathyris TaxID=212925 RepID=UPI003313CA3C